MILTIDIGNSRIKWAQWQASVIIARGVIAYDKEDTTAAFDKVFAGIERPAEVYAVCVAGDATAQSVASWAKQNWQCDIGFVHTERSSLDISHGYDKPENHGTDRWAAVIGARQLFPGESLCIINAGTAVTVDLLQHGDEQGDCGGRHLGGYILPSYDTMYAALMGNTENIESTMRDGRVPAAELDFESTIPGDTVPAVVLGLHRMLRSGLRDICSQAGTVLKGPFRVVLTGGAAKTILAYPDMPAMTYCPDLIMHGVYTIMNREHQPVPKTV